MSCSLKLTSSRSWSGSQRRINSLAEETAAMTIVTTTSATHNQGQNKLVSATSSRIQLKGYSAKRGEDTAKLVKYIDDNLIGKNATFFGPFGRRKVVYCDYTATGRSLQFLEDYITKEVLPFLSDSRSSTSICSFQSSLFRHEARDVVKQAVGASDEDAVLFTGQGTAGALRTLLRHLDLTLPTILFVGPFEHHANLRPWREYGVRVIRIAETREGFLDLNDLERKLVDERAENPQSRMIGYFSAASCITGVLADDVATTLLLRQHDALSIWDYTSAAPSVKMEMNPNLPGVGETTVHKDAIIFAGHKLIGGAQSPGVLVVKRSLLAEDTSPEDMRDSHRYLRDPELREECGTAGVVEAIRCGLAVQLKENVTTQSIASRNEKISKQVLSHVRTIPELILLGSSSQNVKRLPIFSFMVRHPRGTFLHHNFICAVLNDVFGVQARGGCACAGRYAHDLMGIDSKLAKEFEELLLKSGQAIEGLNEEVVNAEVFRPGFTRISFPFNMPESEVAYVLEALKMVATEGWKLLPQYILNPETGEWRHQTNSVLKERRGLGSIRYTDGRMISNERRISGAGVFPQTHAECLQTARNIFNRSRKMAQRCPMQVDRSAIFTKRLESLRWFMLPSEAQDLLLGHSQSVKQQVPFDPVAHRLAMFEANLPCRILSSESPRHRSLPALTCPPSLRSKAHEEDCRGQRSPATCPGSPMPGIKFAVGEAVTSAAAGILGAKHSVSRLVTTSTGEAFVVRARCNSLGSTTSSSSMGGESSPIPIPLSPQTLASLGIATAASQNRHNRHCSCSSQTELNGSLDLESNGSPGRSASSLGHVPQHLYSPSAYGRSSPIPPYASQNSEDDLKAYFKEVTKEIATEIKSEIREVISKVDDALSESSLSDSNVTQQVKYHEKPQQQHSNDSFSASDVAEYLLEFSKEMASEVKSEIRCMVNSVDGLHMYSPEEKNVSGCTTPSEKRRGMFSNCSTRPLTPVYPAKIGELSQQDSKMSSECSSDETVVYVVKNNPEAQSAECEKNTDEDEVEDDDHSEPEKVLPKIYSAVNSVSSQDSGINLSFHDSDRSVDLNELGRSSSADSNNSLCSRRHRLTSGVASFPLCKQSRATNDDLSEDDEIFLTSQTPSGKREANSGSGNTDEDQVNLLWHCPPKNIWKPAVEAMQEFNMIKDADKVLVCMSMSGRSSMTLLHTLHQYRFYATSKGVDFDIGVASVDSQGSKENKALSDYLKALAVPYFYVGCGDDEKPTISISDVNQSARKGLCSFCDKPIRAKLYAVAKENRYNVLAVAQNLDDLTEGFLSSVFNGGKLKTMKAHYYIKEHSLRVIRPFVYVREKAFRQFAESKKLPAFADSSSSQESSAQKLSTNEELIARHDQTYPRVYWSLRSALRPLISAQSLADQPQKRQQHRRPRTNSFNSVPIANLSAPLSQRSDDTDETDEEAVF